MSAQSTAIIECYCTLEISTQIRQIMKKITIYKQILPNAYAHNNNLIIYEFIIVLNCVIYFEKCVPTTIDYCVVSILYEIITADDATEGGVHLYPV